MKTPLSSCLRRLLMAALVSAAFAVPALRSAGAAPTVAKPTINAPVTVADTGDNWTLDNGIVKMTVLKRSGKMTSLVYQGQETLNGRSESW